MSESLRMAVQRVWQPMLTRRGFVFDSSNEVDEDGRLGEVTYFHNGQCRLQVFWSPQNGELGCKIAPLSAPIEHGLFGNSEMWKSPDILSGLLGTITFDNRTPATTLDERLTRKVRWIDANLDAAIAALNPPAEG
ncbi:MAG: hypothetical protein LLG14_16815 [Nocardiaceae bacterium]|nr:hypothetical protein [Nocardiaceae bacterium]